MEEAVKPGQKLESDSGAAAIVVRAPEGAPVTLQAGGPVLLGKRYTCDSCGAEVLITKAGESEPVCHETAMVIAQAKPLPSSD